MSFAYVAIFAVVAFLAIVATIAVLSRWNNPVPATVDRAWWHTWMRTALLAVVAFACGAIGALSGNWATGASPLFVTTYVGLPILCSLIGVKVTAFRVEVFVLWAIWSLGAIAAGATPTFAALTALAVSFPCLTFGAVVAKLGVLRKWTWKDIWTPQRKLTGAVEER